MSRLFDKKASNRWLVILPVGLSLFGLVMIFEASSVSALHVFADQFYYLKRQALWLISGLVLLAVFSQIDLRLLKKIAFPLFGGTFLLLVLVLIPGLGHQVLGGRRWFDFGFMSFQPAELAKLSLVIYLAALLEKPVRERVFALVLAATLGLIVLEPDMGTAAVIGLTAFVLYFVAGAPWKKIALSGLLAVIATGALTWLSTYRRGRLLAYLSTWRELENSSYHVRQALIALGSGGWFGRGLGQSRQKFLFLPEVSTDSIFAIIAEELGLIGAVLLIFVYAWLVLRTLRVVGRIGDRFGQLLGTGIIVMIGFQTLVNLAAIISLVPLTGIPLPFVSYGGSALLINLIGVGILYNLVQKYQPAKR